MATPLRNRIIVASLGLGVAVLALFTNCSSAFLPASLSSSSFASETSFEIGTGPYPRIIKERVTNRSNGNVVAEIAFTADQFLVQLQSGRQQADLENLLANYPGYSIQRSLPLLGWYLVRFPSSSIEETIAAAENLSRHRDVIRAMSVNEITQKRGLSLVPGGSEGVAIASQDNYWWLRDIKAPEAWDIHSGDCSTIRVGIFDTGIDYNHPELAPNMWINTAEQAGLPGVDDDGNGFADDIYGYNFEGFTSTELGNLVSDPMDTDGHGTAVAGAVGAFAANGNGGAGVCWNIQLVAVKGTYASIADKIMAISYMEAVGVDIVNMSFVFETDKKFEDYNILEKILFGSYDERPLKTAIEQAVANSNILFVAATGNTSRDIDSLPTFPASFDSYGMITVSASDQNSKLTKFSSYGFRSADIAAPGINMQLPFIGNYESYLPYGFEFVCESANQNCHVTNAEGTSVAAPVVTGAAALYYAYQDARALPRPSPEVMRQKLMLSSRYSPTLVNLVASSGILDLEGLLLDRERSLDPIMGDLPMNELSFSMQGQLTKLQLATTDNVRGTTIWRCTKFSDRVVISGDDITNSADFQNDRGFGWDASFIITDDKFPAAAIAAQWAKNESAVVRIVGNDGTSLNQGDTGGYLTHLPTNQTFELSLSFLFYQGDANRFWGEKFDSVCTFSWGPPVFVEEVLGTNYYHHDMKIVCQDMHYSDLTLGLLDGIYRKAESLTARFTCLSTGINPAQ